MGDYAGAWLRVSGTGQDEANQLPDITGWITGHDYELRRTYEVHAKSASKGEHQQQLDQMLCDMRAGLITVLVVWAADRIERRGALSALTLAEQVRLAGGRIEYVKDTHLNAVNEMSDVMLALTATVAREETRRKKERVKMARERVRTDGGFVGRPAWGYEITGEKYARTLVPTADGRRLVPQVYQRVIDGESLATVGAWLAAETGRDWWPTSLAKVIRNTTYRGVVQDATGRVVHRCEPLVDAATWKRAGEALAGRPKRGPSNPATRAMLSGVLSCPVCDTGSPMYRIKAGKGASAAFYYRCSGRGAARKGCGNMVRASAVDAAVDQIIMTDFDEPVKERRLVAGNAAEIEARLEEIRFEIAQLGTLDLDDAAYDRRLSELRAQRDRVRATEVVPDRVELTDTGERYAAQWKQTPAADRGPWLARHGFAVYASRAEVTVTLGTSTVTVSL